MNIGKRIEKLESSINTDTEENSSLAERLRLARERHQRGEITVHEITGNSKLAQRIREARERVKNHSKTETETSLLKANNDPEVTDCHGK